jgi:nitrite reductase/ring-hydroxylating ferredoxin subunit
MATWVRICEASDVPAGQVRGFHVPIFSFPILIAHVDGRFLASSSICPHEDVSLLGGDLHGEVLTCPGHGYDFDLATGRCAHDAGLRLRRFPVRLDGGALYVEIDLHRGGQ